MPSKPRFSLQPTVPLAGSEKAPAASIESGSPAATGKLTVSVIVRRKSPLNPKTLGKPGTPHLTRAQYTAQHGADIASAKLVTAFAREYGLTIEPVAGTRTIQLTASVAAMQKAFGVTLAAAQIDGQIYRVREGTICIPQELEGHVVAVLGLDNRPQAKPHFRVGLPKPEAVSKSYTPVQVGALYGVPATATATGQTIGIIELGGGFRATDIKAYFKTLGRTAPTVTAVLVDKAKNSPSNANGADGEVMLDIEVCAAIAPGAKIAVYFAPNTDQGFIDAITTAVHDRTNKPSVISISWGGPESSWTAQSIAALDAACQTAAALGVTITVAAGDDGSTDGGTGNNVDFPASSPHVLACGGTTLEGAGTTISSEVVWNETASNEGATGGGVSAVFPLPTWQKSANVPAPPNSAGGRGVPDVSGDADPVTGYTIRVDSQTITIGGTSAVAPLWAGLIALANAQNKSPAGFINPVIYAAAAKKAFRDITSGNNGAYTAGPGWDACTGLGSPNATALFTALAPAKSTIKAPAVPVPAKTSTKAPVVSAPTKTSARKVPTSKS